MKRLRHLRQQRSWSQAELARQARVNQTTISLLETGRFVGYPAQLEKIAQALHTSASGLLDDIELVAKPQARRR